MVASRGPLPKPVRRRMNKPPVTGRSVQVARPAMPRTLTAEAKAEWRRIVPELERMGLVALVDRAILIRYCRAWDDWVDIDAKLQEKGPLINGHRYPDELVRNPLWRLRNDAEAMLSDLGKQLGLTPNARLRAGVVHEQAPEEAGEDGPTAIDEYKARLAK